jgi:hypothetical protein
MALKQSNKNRKKNTSKQTQEEINPIKSWWWFPNKPKLYIVGTGVLIFVLLFLI